MKKIKKKKNSFCQQALKMGLVYTGIKKHPIYTINYTAVSLILV